MREKAQAIRAPLPVPRQDHGQDRTRWTSSRARLARRVCIVYQHPSLSHGQSLTDIRYDYCLTRLYRALDPAISLCLPCPYLREHSTNCQRREPHQSTADASGLASLALYAFLQRGWVCCGWVVERQSGCATRCSLFSPRSPPSLRTHKRDPPGARKVDTFSGGGSLP